MGSQHQKVRVNLSNANFPFHSDFEGRTIIVAQNDQNYNYIDQIGETVRDRGIPQAFYMHNVVPTSQGYQAVAYDLNIPAMAGSTGNFDTVFPLYYTVPTSRVLFAPALGYNYIFDATVGVWTSRLTTPTLVGQVDPTTMVTTAYNQGTTYICYSLKGVYKYNTSTKAMDTVAITGIVGTSIKGICTAYGYTIAWDANNNIYWSAIPTPTDFTPSLITGAGSGTPAGMNGNVNFCVPVAGGFLVYCERNVVSATYTGNLDFPFAFKEVPGSGGVNSIEQVTWQSNQSAHYGWTTAGLQQLNLNSAINVFPEASEFFSKLIFEDFDEVTLKLTTTYLSFPLYTKLSCVSNRYVIFSYGVTPVFTHALVWDLYLNRWGKVKIPHIKAFEWNSPNPYGSITYAMLKNLNYGLLRYTTYGELNTAANSAELANKNIAFLDQYGRVKTLNLDLAGVTQLGGVADGVLLIGKFQFSRGKFITHQYTEIENVVQGNNFSYYLVPTIDGKTLIDAVAGVLVTQGPNTVKYGKTIKGYSMSSLLIGAFNVVSLLIDFTLGGNR